MQNIEVIEIAARTAHEVNRAYCVGLGDGSQRSWDEAPEWQRASAVEGAKLIAAHPETTPQDSHASWCAAKIDDGWTCGPVKDPERKTHPCLVPYGDLRAADAAAESGVSSASALLSDEASWTQDEKPPVPGHRRDGLASHASPCRSSR